MFAQIRKQVQDALSDSHMTTLESTQLRAFNTLDSIDSLLKLSTQ